MFAHLETAARLAPLGTLILAIIALSIAVRQLKTVRQNEAKRQYSQFLFNSCDSKINGHFVRGICPTDISSDDYRRYKWYLASYLFAAEEVLEQFPGDKEWETTIRGVLNLHASALQSVDRCCYSTKLQNMISAVLAGAPKQQREAA